MQAAAPTPQASGKLFAVCPDLAKLLVVVAMRKGIYASTLMEMWHRLKSLKMFCNFSDLGKVTRNKVKVIEVVPSGDRRAVDICLTLIKSKPRSTSLSYMSTTVVF
jgi:hypothetical protein